MNILIILIIILAISVIFLIDETIELKREVKRLKENRDNVIKFVIKSCQLKPKDKQDEKLI